MLVNRTRTPLAEDETPSGWALLIVDLVSSWDFEDAEKLTAGALRIAPHIAALKGRCTRRGVPAVYVNDNRGRWRSDFRQIVRLAADSGSVGRAICVDSLPPREDDYSVLKPKHSGFFATPLDLLLRHLRAKRLMVTGISTDQCILLTAMEAQMRDYEVVVPRDCVATQTPARHARALAQMAVADIATPLSTSLRFPEVEDSQVQEPARA